MSDQHYNYFLWLLIIIDITLLIFSLVFCFKDFNPVYMRSFPIYCLVNVIVELLTKLFPSIKGTDYNIFTLFELLYFSYFLFKLIESKITKRVVQILNSFFIFYFIVSIIKNGVNISSTPFVLFESIILIIPCIIYFKELFKKLNIVNIRREPSFWMVTGILFYFFILIPTILLSAYYYYQNMNDVAGSLYAISNYSQLISYVLFIIAMTCRRKELY
jgi:hypothetical protein